jgi:hypothetical protein
MYILGFSLAAAAVGEMRVSARWGGRVRTTGFFEHPAGNVLVTAYYG